MFAMLFSCSDVVGSLHVEGQRSQQWFPRVSSALLTPQAKQAFRDPEVWRSRSHEATPSDAAGERKSLLGDLRRLAVDGQHWLPEDFVLYHHCNLRIPLHQARPLLLAALSILRTMR